MASAPSSLQMLFEYNNYNELFPPFQEQSPNGFAGFVPSAQWLQDLYDNFIEQHVQEMNQHTAMLSGDIIAIDHSFKMTKQIAKINGVQVFIGLLTMTNEKGEIQLCNLVASKSQSQYESALRNLSNSLAMYGHPQPSICYTDNMADKPFVESIFPSLHADIVPVENHSHLDPLLIPDNVQIITLQSAQQIDDIMHSILQMLPDHDGGTGLIVGFDSEYNVEVSGRGYITGHRPTAIVQIALGKKVFILQIGPMLARGQLPAVFKQVLANPCILKVGCNVGIDLKYLEQAVSAAPHSFVGALDLAKLAKEHFLVKHATIGLADLCASILGRHLNKNVSEQLSTLWENEDLSQEQLQYAALDAYASLRIYETLVNVPAPSPLPSDIPPAPCTPIILFGGDKLHLIAHGQISEHYKPNIAWDSITVTNLRCLVEITEVYVPAAIISTHHKRTLESFGKPPFHVVCLKSHLCIATTRPFSFSSMSPETPLLTQTSLTSHSHSDTAERSENANLTDDTTSSVVLCNSSDGPVPENVSLANYEADLKSKSDGDEAIQQAAKMPWVTDIWSRVLKDPWHFFDGIYISTSHGLRLDFSRALRDAVFIPDPEDKQHIEAWGSTQNPPLTFEYLSRSRPKWLFARCKCTIPPPEQLYPLVEHVFCTYGPLKDAKTGAPLFNSAAWSTVRNQLELIRKGFLSDPPGVAFFTPIRRDHQAGGLQIYRCSQGTNFTEGGVHCHLPEHLPQHGVSIKHVHHRLQDLILCHNTRVGTYNTTGKPWPSHYSIWLTNDLQEMLLSLKTHNLISEIPDGIIPKGWINGNFYLPTAEVTGILPIPEKTQIDCGMQHYNPEFHRSQPQQFVASLQHTRRPVLPIHNKSEEELFRNLITTNVKGASEPNWENIARAWNDAANSNMDISYKLIEHFRLYYNGEWKARANVVQTLSQTGGNRKQVKRYIHDSSRTKHLPPALESPLTLHHVPKGLLPLEERAALASAVLAPSSSTANSGLPYHQLPILDNWLQVSHVLLLLRPSSIVHLLLIRHYPYPPQTVLKDPPPLKLPRSWIGLLFNEFRRLQRSRQL
ncbi:hypothetical protein GYMLUDRAFT_261499 [Collybiopsis luxurians FD-317 M1]|uniref:3'-5' exonuclease n=1 Tax=Collybiopsis luxurians FD-317 M1 TaxID=944289 RepID=A0A0D0BA31_9AGAR|nr:hypothetical protein GYMLUDRAFT_261499 [Collybiopsis luxurians FD-317 M1]